MTDPTEPDALLAGLRAAMPVALAPYALPARSGLVVVDEVDGFCTPGSGPLAPPAADARIEAMVEETDGLARRFLSLGLPVLAFRDSHVPGRAEPPYPPHCEVGTGHDELVARLRWLETATGARVVAKDCINAAVGAGETLYEWVRANRLEAVVFVGICTDICIADAVTTLLSARNHYVAGPDGERPMLGSLRDVVVYEPGCATYDLPLAAARSLGLPDTSAHPRGLAQHLGLSVMQARGAVLSDALDWTGR